MKSPFQEITLRYVDTRNDVQKPIDFLSFPPSAYLLDAIRESLNELEPLVFEVNELELVIDGIICRGVQQMEILRGEEWTEIVKQYRGESLRGIQAVQWLYVTGLPFQDAEVDRALQGIGRHETNFEELREVRPELFSRTDISLALSEVFANGQKLGPTKRRPPIISEDILNLYHYVAALKRNGLSEMAACKLVVEKYPDLLPPTWQEGGDPTEVLRQKVRRLDNHHQFSQKLDK
jgi:hypothetical protein